VNRHLFVVEEVSIERDHFITSSNEETRALVNNVDPSTLQSGKQQLCSLTLRFMLSLS